MFGELSGKSLFDALPDALNDSGYWGVATATALNLVARGRIVPSVTEDGRDTWRIGPLDHADELHLRQLAAHGDYDELRAFLDAVADVLPRGGAEGPFAAAEPCHVPELKPWADEQIKLSLRIETTDDLRFRAIVQVRGITDPYPQDVRGSGRELDAIRAIGRATWPPLQRLLDQAALTDDEVTELLGTDIEVHWPKNLATSLSAKAVIGEASGKFKANDLLEFNWQLALGDEELTDAEMDVIAEASRPVVKLRDQWVLVDPKLKQKARQQLSPITAVQAVTAALTGTAVVDGEHVDVAPHSLTTAITTVPEIPAPAGLQATLRDYQLHGLRWLAHMLDLGLGACLADDMGLGKTITLIALHLHRRQEPALVVCPASLLGNWEREIHRFAPGTRVTRYHGPQRTLADDGVVLTTYGTMRLDAEALRNHEWGMVVADEAQHIKNPHSGTAKALRSIPAGARVALSGTPVENSLSELWSILDWTTPGLLGTHRAFRTRWPEPDDTLAKVVKPFLLRRRKSDPGVAPELPAKTETDLPVSLTTEQAALYEALTREILDQIAGSDGIARRGLVLKLLTGLKQICNHPSHYLGHATLQGTSGKLDLLDELLDTIVAEDGSALIFTQYVGMARLLEQHIKQPTRFLHGGTPVPQREQMVDDFQQGRAPVFLLSLKAAGTGLNLTRADHVIHFDRWWNPAVEDQATDRAYRIGQTQPVQVHKLVTEGTVEERIAALLQDKRDLADAVLHGGEAAFTELTDAELAELVQLRSL
ncbi:DEAD/DEAH box helicase [Lentzea terrae]|uniref:DEAD/DEAH box helicase n=1 Tax=Lentzea terrae TaxID=2200761 RepID=UPI000DD33D3D|nr:DEAD/DEAH box helicase [Lentzea terrae]